MEKRRDTTSYHKVSGLGIRVEGSGFAVVSREQGPKSYIYMYIYIHMSYNIQNTFCIDIYRYTCIAVETTIGIHSLCRISTE